MSPKQLIRAHWGSSHSLELTENCQSSLSLNFFKSKNGPAKFFGLKRAHQSSLSSNHRGSLGLKNAQKDSPMLTEALKDSSGLLKFNSKLFKSKNELHKIVWVCGAQNRAQFV